MQANDGALTDTEAYEIGKKGSGRVPRPEPFFEAVDRTCKERSDGTAFVRRRRNLPFPVNGNPRQSSAVLARVTLFRPSGQLPIAKAPEFPFGGLRGATGRT